VTETADPDVTLAEEGSRDSIRARLADLRREAAELALCETRIAAAAHRRDLRRLAVDAAGPLTVAFLLLTAFALANAAAVCALSGVMPSWAAALVLAGAWVVVGVLLALGLWVRGEHGRGLRWWRVFTGSADETLDEVRTARDRAEAAMRTTLERLAPALAKEAAEAAVPMASAVAAGMAAGVVDEVLDAGDDLLEGSDDFVESITEDVPGGGVAAAMWDVVLLPGRVVVRVAGSVLQRPTRAG